MTSMKNLLSGNSADSPSPIQNGNVHNNTVDRNGDCSDRNRQMHVHAISNGHMPNESHFTYGVQREASQSSKDSPVRHVQGSSSTRTSNNTEITSLESPEISKSGTATPGQVNVESSQNNNTEVSDLNPIALRKPRLYTIFGLSECSRVNIIMHL